MLDCRVLFPRRLLLAIGICLMGSAAGARSANTAPEIVVIETPHYALHYTGPKAEAQAAGKVLEAAYAGFKAWFGAEPELAKGERLRVRFAADRAGFNAAIRADGTVPPGGAGGYYWPGTRTAYLFRQPTIYFTRVLLIHEAAHQFHFLARTRNQSPGAAWYTEGLAEFLSWHMWDGKTLVLAQRATISLKDFPAAALRAFDAKGFDLGAVIEGKAKAGRPVFWALFRYLATGREGKPRKGFQRLMKKIDGGAKPAKVFRDAFRKPAKVQAAVRAMLLAAPQPWAQVFNQWELQAPGRFRGTAGVVSFCHARGASQAIQARLAVPATGAWKGGLLLSYVDAGTYTVLLVDPSGQVVINARRAGQWKRLASGRIPAPEAGGSLALSARCEAVGVTATVAGVEIGPVKVPRGRLGLAVDASTLVFHEVRVTPRPDETPPR